MELTFEQMVEDDEPIKKVIESVLKNSGLAEARAAKVDIDDLLMYVTSKKFIISLIDFLDYFPHSMMSAYISHDLCLKAELIRGLVLRARPLLDTSSPNAEISRSPPQVVSSDMSLDSFSGAENYMSPINSRDVPNNIVQDNARDEMVTSV
jgi:hypothetical protein